jgi:hypothetical protein
MAFGQVSEGITEAMPGIANKYFRIVRHAPSVCGMTSAPCALGVVFRRPTAAALQGGDGDGGEVTELCPGDLVLTGSPADNGIPQEATR